MGSKTDGYTKTYTDVMEERGRKENEHYTKIPFFLGVADEWKNLLLLLLLYLFSCFLGFF